MSDNNYHPGSERKYFTQQYQYTPPNRDRRIFSDGEVNTQCFDGGMSRPVPLPRNRVQSPRNGSERQTTNTWTNPGLDPQGTSEVERLQTQVRDLMRENKRLQETIEMMKKREDDLILREQSISERERELLLKKSRMDSENGDKEFELNQKRRDLQLLEDQLHMKNKDLQHQEFDLRNADGPEDLSSSKMADLADRTYELDKREEELKRKQEYYENWQRKLDSDNMNYQRRMSELLHREADLQGFVAPTGQAQPYTAPYPANQQFPQDQRYDEPQRYAESQFNQDRTEPPPVIPSPRGVGDPNNWSSEKRQGSTIQQQQSVNSVDLERTMSEPFPDQMPPPSPPLNEPIISAPGAGFIDDEDLARQIAEEEEKRERENREQQWMLDQLLALQLQDEDLTGTDYAASVGQLSSGANERTEDVIKRDLDSRLSREQYRQRREREDFLYAQNLVDEANNSDTNN